MKSHKVKLIFWIPWILILLVLIFLLKMRFFPEWIGFLWTTWLLIFLGSITYEKSPKDSKFRVVTVGVMAVSSIWINNSVSPLISPTISTVEIKSNYINTADNGFYLTQEVEYKIKFPLIPIVNFVVTPLKEPVELFPKMAEEEFKAYEINPFCDRIDIKDNKIFIDIKRLSSLIVQELPITIRYRRKVISKLEFPLAFSLYRENQGEFIITISYNNKYPFTIKNLIYREDDFAKKSGFGEFLNRNKYEQIPIHQEGAAGAIFIDKDGKWNFLVTSAIEPGGEMRFYLMVKEISTTKDKSANAADILK